MFYFFLFCLFFLFSVLSSTIVPVNLVLLLVISMAVNTFSFEALLTAFLAGILFDLIKGERLGLSSLIFLITSYLVMLYKAKVRQTHFLYLVSFSLVIFLTLNYFYDHHFFWLRSLFSSLLIIPINLLTAFLRKRYFNEK